MPDPLCWQADIFPIASDTCATSVRIVVRLAMAPTPWATPTAHLFDGSVHCCCGVAGPAVFQYRAMGEFPFAVSLSFD